MFFVALHFRKLKNKKLIIKEFEKTKWLKIRCKCQSRGAMRQGVGHFQ